jgi:hypothetical protein
VTRTFRVGAIVLVLTALASQSGAAEQAPEQPGALPQLVFELVDPAQKVVVGGRVALALTIINGSRATAIKHAEVVVPSILGNRPSVGGAETVPVPLRDESELRQPGQRIDLGPLVIGGEAASWSGRTIWDVIASLTYRPRKEHIVARVTLTPIVPEPVESVLTKEITVQAEPGTEGLFAGAVVGALLGAAFAALMRFEGAIRQLPVPRSARAVGERMGHTSLVGAFMFVKASVAAGIVILILQSASGVSLPIQVSVNDFFGALVLALAGDRIASAVYNWMT